MRGATGSDKHIGQDGSKESVDEVEGPSNVCAAAGRTDDVGTRTCSTSGQLK